MNMNYTKNDRDRLIDLIDNISKRHELIQNDFEKLKLTLNNSEQKNLFEFDVNAMKLEINELKQELSKLGLIY